VKLVRKVRKALLAHKDHKVSQVHKVHKVLLDRKDHKASLAHKVHKDQWVILVLKDQVVLKV
jgi:hypothetical protein